MISATATSSARDVLEDQFLNFNCYKFSRGINAGRPLSSRTVSAEECLCTRDTTKICDSDFLYSFHFRETTDEEQAERQRDTSEKYPDISPDRIGVFRPNTETFIHVPPHFLDVLWRAALAADGVLRSIQLTVQPQKGGGWAVFEVYLKEEIAETFELPVDKHSRPKAGPPRANPVVIELREMRAWLRWRGKWGIVPSIAIIAAGVLVALWIASVWHPGR
jgi:hypothetical protein